MRYYCNICGKEFDNPLKAVECEKKHDVVYVPVEKSEVFRLVQFFMTREEQLIPTNFLDRLMRITRSIKINPPKEEVTKSE